MAHQCRSCGRDLNNNYTPYSSGYPNENGGTNHDRQQQQQQQIPSYNTRSSVVTTSAQSAVGGMTSSNQNPKTQVTAKVMFGSVGAIKELREKEKARNGTSARAGRRN